MPEKPLKTGQPVQPHDDVQVEYEEAEEALPELRLTELLIWNC